MIEDRAVQIIWSPFMEYGFPPHPLNFLWKKKSKFHYLCYCNSNKENKSVGLSYALTTVFWKKTKGR